MLKIKIGFILSVLIIGLLSFTPKAFAATGNIYLAGGGSVVQGSSITIALRINPGTSVNAVQATVNYNASMLQYDSDTIGAFSTCTQSGGGNGALSYSCVMLGSSTSSDSLIANLTFTALAGSGSSALTISNANAANNGTYTDPTTTGTSVSFSMPAQAPAPTPTAPTGAAPTPTKTYHYYAPASTSPTPSPAATPTPTAVVALPKVKLSLAQLIPAFTNARLIVNVNTPVSVYFVYGINKHKLDLKTTAVNISSKAAINFNSQNLIPGTSYYYQLIAQINGQTVASSPVASFKTVGFTVQVAVLDSNYHPIANQPVTLHTVAIAGVTNSMGVATFYNVPPGMHHLDYSNGSRLYSEPVYVADTISLSKTKQQTAKMQTAAVVLKSYLPKPRSLWWLITSLALVFMIVGFVALNPKRVLSFSKYLLSIKRK